MELRHLRYFIAVAEELSFTRAAKRLRTAQPSLSRQIKDLEQHVGIPLFTRSSRAVVLTSAGRILLDEARIVLDQASTALARTRLAGCEDRAALNVGLVPGVEIDQLKHVMASIEQGSRHTRIVLHSQSSPELIANLHDRLLDIAFVRPSPQCQGLELKIVQSEPLIVAIPTGHRFAGRSSLDISELSNEPLIDVTTTHAPVLFGVIERFAESKGISLKPIYKADNLMMALSLISTVGGLCLVPESAVRLFPNGVSKISLAGVPPTIDLALAWHPENGSDALHEFLKRYDNPD